MNYSRKAAVL